MAAITSTLTIAPNAQAPLSSAIPFDNATPLYTIDELIRRRAQELGDFTLVGYPKGGITDFEDHSARAVDRYVDAAVVRLQSLGLEPVDPSIEKPPVVGILARSGLHVLVTFMALNRLGYTLFTISTRLAAPALIQLLTMANCSKLLTTDDFHSVLAEVQKERKLEILPLISHSDYYGKEAPVFSRAYDPEKEAAKVAIIIHSSGSTGLPKPIYLTNRSCLGAFATNLNMRCLIASPLFHSHGVFETFRAIFSRKPIYIANYNFPLTAKSLVDMLSTVKPDLFHAIPYMIKLLSETEEGVVALASAKLVFYAGSACPDDLGTRLVKRGVNLAGNFGCTEIGRIMTSVREPGDMDWNYFRLVPSAAPFVLMDEVSPGLFEAVALDGLKSKSTVNSDDPPNSFRTRDLLAPHPTRAGLWKYVCRLDDRFTLVNGEKILPIPIEGRIRQEPIVREAVVFGDGRAFPGVLIVKSDRASDIPDDQFLEQVWPAVEAANANAETFSRIPKELVIVVPTGAKYPQTDKGTFIRVPVYRQFEKEIDHAYAKFDNEQGGSLSLPAEELELYLLDKMNKHLGVELASTSADFFSAGIDSLQCIQMWNLMKKELDLGGRQAELGQNILYETGNAKKLAAHLTSLRKGEQGVDADEFKAVEDLISRYSSFQPLLSAPPAQDVVLLTGVTGGLGAHILAQLAANPNVAAIWTLVRGADDSAAADRVAMSLEARNITLEKGQSSKIVAVACDLGRTDLGLDASKFYQLRCSLTCVVHSAWAVNFNISIESFEAQHIKATHNLIELCLSVNPHPARFFFCSSVSAAARTPRPGTVVERFVTTPAYALPTGYARSKYVAEHITRNAARSTGVPAKVLRIGQLVGDTMTGEWNTTEAIPLMIQTAETLGALPGHDEDMTWLPVDYAAKAIVELADIASSDLPSRMGCGRKWDPDLVYHVVNPARFNWTRDMLPALKAAGLEFEVLPVQEWLEKLRQSDRDPVKNPPIKLLDWFETKFGMVDSTTRNDPLVYETEESVKASPSLGAVPDVTQVEFVKKMVERLQARWHGA
ncbi:acetyl-CoA synthetase-like protein [Thozetella sp. PMI_491]|nr:acetyl-CoA synthetase-like protein [Thozetella sp. PMI_491]